MSFEPTMVRGERIKQGAEYEGVRLRFESTLGNAIVPMQIDVAFGDVVVPAAAEIGYPTILDMSAPRLRGYPREAVVAEKFQAMVFLGTLNSRMKDFYDIWLLARQFDFDGQTLAEAITATFSNRGTAIDPDPVALTPEFTESETATRRWEAFVKKGRFAEAPATLADLAAFIARFLVPVARACRDNEVFAKSWRAPDSWQAIDRDNR